MTTTQKEDARRYDPDGILKDGERYRAPMLMMDAAQDDAAAITRAALASAYQPGAGHRPGTIVADGIQGQLAATERQVRRDLRLDAQQQLWRNPPPLEIKNDADPAHAPHIKAPQSAANAPWQEIDLEDFHAKLNAKKRDAWKAGA
jgi:hypothetical protein